MGRVVVALLIAGLLVPVCQVVPAEPAPAPPRKVVWAGPLYEAAPGAAVAANGDWLVSMFVCSRNGATDLDTALARSADNGRTWDVRTLFTHTGSGPTAAGYGATGLARATTTGTLVLTLSHQTVPGPVNNTGRPYVSRSTDDGKTWSDPVRIAPDADALMTGLSQPYGPIVEPTPGTLLQPVYGMRATLTGGIVGLMRSTDDGRTWSYVGTIHSNLDNGFMPTEAAVHTRDGDARHLIAFWRDDAGNEHHLYTATSDDGGRTWTTRPNTQATVFQDQVQDGARGYWASPFLLRMPNGHLILFACWRQYEAPFHPEKSFLAAFLSTDGGKTWGGKKPVAHRFLRFSGNGSSGDYGYPYPVLTREGRIFMPYMDFGKGGCDIYYETFTEEWLAEQ